MSPKESSKQLTIKQETILDFIKESIKDSGFPPTVREIGERFNITVKGAYDHVKAIEKKGYIKTEQNKSRAIVVLNEEEEVPVDAINIPLLGRIAAGSPILAEENIEEYLSFPKSMFRSGEYFALNVKGDSMIEGGIYDGDIAIIKKQSTANNGEVIAALLTDEATLKRLKVSGNKVQLLPDNPAYEPIIADNVTILGKLIALFRKY
ncbi:MAG TPA: transcriptional repressor LexA [Spirochaetota bacterium]|nr:transcriptional repressor LexA [Spirochaetota bacterium]HPL17114.1 transcriptional repressor LexA [Spirochaetota bacterium]HQJ72792.1 transcriptional repressor LexA [Spirochaetota bacterium]HRS79107.1 transcriptional repressor LexA [Spirochaetota bacterium]HRT77068.1 transcriptional repressor LexA [Spirochaetota bacterium]